ncbi:amidase [Solicola sp. PLA-1-18]|uniref:amidase n=1 Tax=Solicola sp. PLA-1-18 TaxID=3380532 RepID=UPI003B8288BA
MTLDDVLADVARRDGELSAFVHVDAHDVGGEGPLAGRLVAVKDNVAVRGAPWACGSATRWDGPPADHDAEVVRRLRAAGAAVVGTTNLDEFAMGASTESSAWGPTRNPHDPRRTAGGSSGGSGAAVAAYGVLAVGTDTGGSIREPAAFCGIVGVAPSPGTVPTDGVVDFAPTMDRVGPLAPTLADAALLHEVMAGVTDGRLTHAAEVGAHERLVGRAVGVVVPMSGGRNAPEVVERFEAGVEVLRGLGASVVHVDVPRFGDLLDVYFTLTCVEALPVLEAHVGRGRLGEEAANRLETGRRLLGSDEHRDALAVRERILRDAAEAFDRCEVMVSPTVPLVAPLVGRVGVDDPLATPRTDWWTVEANLAGIPAMSVPAGTGGGMPVGFQLMAPPGRDDRLYRFGAAVEAGLS